MKYLFSLAIIAFFTPSVQAQGWQRIIDSTAIIQIIEQPDGQTYLALENSLQSANYNALYLDQLGRVKRKKYASLLDRKMRYKQRGKFIYGIQDRTYGIWDTSFNQIVLNTRRVDNFYPKGIFDFIGDSSHMIIATDTLVGSWRTADNQLIWTKKSFLFDFVVLNNSFYSAVSKSTSIVDNDLARIEKTAASGVVQSTFRFTNRNDSYPYWQFHDLEKVKNDLLLLERANWVGDSFRLTRLDTTGLVKWQFIAKPLSNSINNMFITVAKDNSAYVIATANDSLNTSVIKIDSLGHGVWQKKFFMNFGYDMRALGTPDGGIWVYSHSPDVDPRDTKTTICKISKDGDFLTTAFRGKVFFDQNANCQVDSIEPTRPRTLVKATSIFGDNYYGITDSTGRYEVLADTGKFNLQVIPPNTAFWQTCLPISRSIPTFNYQDTTNLLIRKLYDCPSLHIDMTTPNLRRCFENPTYIRYSNLGTKTADNAYIEIKLDSLLEYISAERPLSSRNGQTLRFNLGTLKPDTLGFFAITTRVRCGDSTSIRQTLCSEARIFPDTICPPVSAWSGANLKVTGLCLRDSVEFTVTNTGTSASTQRLFVVYKDQTAHTGGSVPPLAPNSTFKRKFPSQGKTWRMTVEQVTSHPLSKTPTAVIEGCSNSPSDTISRGFVNAFGFDDATHSADVECVVITGSYDPNDKAGRPTGYGTAKTIDRNQDIEYLIRFQNTGTDTAFKVVIRDTIDTRYLDITSIELGAASHGYTTKILGKNTLEFTFDKINLVDSFRNEPKSHGFIKFRIKQKMDVPLETKIQNSAAIYFDFNDPIITNTTLHTIGRTWIQLVKTNDSPIFSDKVKILPNPFSHVAIFEIDVPNDFKNAQFHVFDITGKLVRNEPIKSNKFEFNRHNLPTGLYTFRIIEEEQLISTGKFIIN